MPTTNPVPSQDPSDLLFNAGKLDEVVSGDGHYYTDRLGVNRRTMEGISAAADVVLGGIGYAPPVAYAAGISMTLTTQTVEYSGEVYAPKVGNLPFTTSGTFEAEKFRLIQGVSSVDLSASSGSALVGYDGGTVQDVLDGAVSKTDYAELRAYIGRATRIYITGTLVTKKPAGIAGVFQYDSTDTMSADNGGTIIVGADGRRWKRDFTGAIHVKWFGALGDNYTDDWDAIQAALNYIRLIGGGTLDFGGSVVETNYRIRKPLKLTHSLTMTGNARILPTAGFVSDVIFPTYATEVPQTYGCLAYFNNGTHADDPLNWGYSGLNIDRSIIFDAQYHVQAPVGLIMEGITNYSIDAQFTQFQSTGLWVKYYCWVGSSKAYITNCRTAFLKLGPASNGINLSGFVGYGQNDTPDYGFIIDGDNNGIDFGGAAIEKTKNHILWTGGSGPSTISGVDFEICSNIAIHVYGTAAGLQGRPAGPITIIGSFLEAGEACVQANNAIVIVQGCRLRATPVAFKTTGVSSRIYDNGNVIEDSVVKIAEGNVFSDSFLNGARSEKTRAPWDFDTTTKTSYAHEIFAYGYEQNLPTSFLKYKAQLADPATKRMLTSSEWVTRDMVNGTVNGDLGLVLDYSAGLKNVIPYTAGDTSLGTNAAPFAKVVSKSLVQCAGSGVGVNPENNGEVVFQFTNNTTLTIKAKGSDGVVRIADITLV